MMNAVNTTQRMRRKERHKFSRTMAVICTYPKSFCHYFINEQSLSFARKEDSDTHGH